MQRKIILVLCFALLNTQATASEPKETIVLLHGLGRGPISMLILKLRLQREGYQVISESYASTEQGIEDHTQWLSELLDSCCREGSENTHFVTHSLGGIVLRQYLEKNEFPNLGRVVMLAPPNQGSEIADFFMNWKLFKTFSGPTGQQLGTDANSVPNTLEPVDFDLGVITGNFSYSRQMSRLIPGPDDGVVGVKRARIPGMKDFLVVPRSHSFIMNSEDVASEVVTFIQTGSFTHGESTQQ